MLIICISTDQLTFEFEALDNSGDADSIQATDDVGGVCLVLIPGELQVSAFLHQYGIFILVRNHMLIEEITVINSAIIR